MDSVILFLLKALFLLTAGVVSFILLIRKRPSTRDPKEGWRVYHLRAGHIHCERCRKRYEDGDYIWRDPEGRLVCHVSCGSPGSSPTEELLNAPFDAVRGPLPVVGHVIAAFAPPPPSHNWSGPAPDCGYANLKSGDKPRCTCPVAPGT